MPSPARIVLVDDDASFAKVMSRELARRGLEVRVFGDARGVREAVAADPPEAVILDLNMPGQSGMELLEELRADDPDLSVLVLTGHGAVPEAVAAMRRGALDFLTKPISLDVLEQAVDRAVSLSRIIAENRRLRRLAAVGGRGDSEFVRLLTGHLDTAIERVGKADKSVLVWGESGSGKELVARLVHAASPRRDAAFVTVNCGAIAGNLVGSELFGHVKGAFTGADSKHEGLFVAADGGTLFLDEIGELPVDVQPALLRALQFGEIRPVGSSSTRKVDVRVVAATNRDLRDRIEAGGFREDLYYRIAILELAVPPLRERRPEIGAIARAMLAREAARMDRCLDLSPAALEWLAARDWPGNLRELENAIVRLVVLVDGPEIGVDDLRAVLEAGSVAGRAEARGAGDALPTLRLRDLERMAIDAAMRRHGGNKRAAAEELGIALKTLYNKLARDEPEA